MKTITAESVRRMSEEADIPEKDIAWALIPDIEEPELPGEYLAILSRAEGPDDVLEVLRGADLLRREAIRALAKFF